MSDRATCSTLSRTRFRPSSTTCILLRSTLCSSASFLSSGDRDAGPAGSPFTVPFFLAASSFFICSSHSSSSVNLFFFSITFEEEISARNGIPSFVRYRAISLSLNSLTALSVSVNLASSCFDRAAITPRATWAETGESVVSSSSSSDIPKETCPIVVKRLKVARWIAALDAPESSSFDTKESSLPILWKFSVTNLTKAFRCRPSGRNVDPA
mmetsp:Transcript_15665/g.32413  ORF Transcript_15665/g.32413 Transcript_15665/m.32413 type:complete len:212 (+) Transcript_15665:6050-6685(+)